MKKTKKNEGITLIALVITIIILLILAGISISMLSGNNSILSRAGEAKNITGEKQISERVQLAYLAALSTGKGSITEQLLTDELDKEFGENGYELTTDNTTEEWVIKVNNVERFRVKKSTTVASTPSGTTAGLSTDGTYFIGLKSYGKNYGGDTTKLDNTQTDNPTVDGTGYKFTVGNFLNVTEYNACLCWDGNYGTISSLQDLEDYSADHGINVTVDVFDISSGEWISYFSFSGK